MCNIDTYQIGEWNRIDNIIPELYHNSACNPRLSLGVVQVLRC